LQHTGHQHKDATASSKLKVTLIEQTVFAAIETAEKNSNRKYQQYLRSARKLIDSKGFIPIFGLKSVLGDVFLI
jgi:hypothetical protein